MTGQPTSNPPTVPPTAPTTTNINKAQANSPDEVASNSPPLSTEKLNGDSQLAPPSSQQQMAQQLFCASAMSQLESSCELAESCASGPCPKGQFCFPFTCTKVVKGENEAFDGGGEVNQVPNDNQAPPDVDDRHQSSLCPHTTFTGWSATVDCKEYFKCDNGAPGVVRVCGTDLKFDKVRNECYSEEFVNSFCYGPPLKVLCKEGKSGWESIADCKEYYKCDDGVPGVVSACGQNLKFDQMRKECYREELVDSSCYGPPLTELCDEGKTGWKTMADCTEYYKCENGSPGIIRMCGKNLKFDLVRNECHPEKSVDSLCRGPPLKSAQQGSQEDLCEEGHTGWEVRLGCREYFWCNNGHYDVLHSCGEDLLFDQALELCNFAHLVHCGPAPPKPSPTKKPMSLSRETPGLLGSKGDEIGTNDGPNAPGDYSSSNTKSSSPLQGQVETLQDHTERDTPPWLRNNVILEGNMAPSANVKSELLLLLVPIHIFVF